MAHQSTCGRSISAPALGPAGSGEVPGATGPAGTDSATAGDPYASPAPASAPVPAPTKPVSCAQPNAPALTIEPAEPQTPAIAAQQGISGDVTIVVSLDEASHVIAARVLSSPSVILNDAALRAARASTFRTEVRDCRPVAADYAFVVEFTSN